MQRHGLVCPPMSPLDTSPSPYLPPAFPVSSLFGRTLHLFFFFFFLCWRHRAWSVSQTTLFRSDLGPKPQSPIPPLVGVIWQSVLCPDRIEVLVLYCIVRTYRALLLLFDAKLSAPNTSLYQQPEVFLLAWPLHSVLYKPPLSLPSPVR